MHRLAAYDLPVCALKSYCTQYEKPMILQVFDIHGSVAMMSWRAATGGEAISPFSGYMERLGIASGRERPRNDIHNRCDAERNSYLSLCVFEPLW